MPINHTNKRCALRHTAELQQLQLVSMSTQCFREEMCCRYASFASWYAVRRVCRWRIECTHNHSVCCHLPTGKDCWPTTSWWWKCDLSIRWLAKKIMLPQCREWKAWNNDNCERGEMMHQFLFNQPFGTGPTMKKMFFWSLAHRRFFFSQMACNYLSHKSYWPWILENSRVTTS